MVMRVICDGMLGGVATIATNGGNGAALASFVTGGVVTGAAVVIEQQQFARIVAPSGASCFFCFDGQQHACRIFPSMLHKKPVRANADDGSSTARVSRVRTIRRTQLNLSRRTVPSQAPFRALT